MNYALSFYELCKHLVPPHLQGGRVLTWVTSGGLFWATASGEAWVTGNASKQMAWVRVLVSAVQTLHAQLLTYVDATRYRMQMTGQVIYLEHLLNDRLDPTDRRIRIADVARVIEPLFLQLDGGDLILPLDDEEPPIILYTKEDYTSNVDFSVYLPDTISLTPQTRALVRALVNQYRAAGKTFDLRSYDAGTTEPEELETYSYE